MRHSTRRRTRPGSATSRQASSSDDTFSLVVPNDFTREWIEGHFLGFVKAAARDALARDVRVTLTVREPGSARGRGRAVDAPPGAAPDEQRPVAPASPKYTFDLFVIGSSNRFAHAAALAVAEAPAQAYNPLFIYGGTGLGKTHLLQAIGQYVSEHTKGSTTRYVTSETFMNDFINSLRDKRIEGFKQRYRTYDVLLVDDIQFFEGKERIQEEFFHTFNSLYEAGRQIVISSDRPPKEIATLEERLRSRFEWGLITDIQPPDLETRIAILRKKVTTDRIAVDDPEVLTFIAGRVSTNIRELEGALTRVVAFSSLTGLHARPSSSPSRFCATSSRTATQSRRSRSRGSRRRSRTASGSRSRSSAASGDRRPSPIRARSRCTSPASSPTPRCPRSARSSAGAITRP